MRYNNNDIETPKPRWKNSRVHPFLCCSFFIKINKLQNWFWVLTRVLLLGWQKIMQYQHLHRTLLSFQRIGDVVWNSVLTWPHCFPVPLLHRYQQQFLYWNVNSKKTTKINSKYNKIYASWVRIDTLSILIYLYYAATTTNAQSIPSLLTSSFIAYLWMCTIH